MQPKSHLAFLGIGLLLASGCCHWNDDPMWQVMDTVYVEDEEVQVDLAELVVDDSEHMEFEASSDAEALVAWAEDGTLRLQPKEDWVEGSSAEVVLHVTDSCDRSARNTVEVIFGAEEDTSDDTGDTDEPGDTGDPDVPINPCEVEFSYWQQGSPEAVYLAGDFNDWDPSQTPLEHQGDGLWTVSLELDPGAWPYKFVEEAGGSQSWTCDPDADLIQCDEGYKEASESSWDHACGLGLESCNSMVEVENCTLPTLTAELVDIDRSGRGIEVQVSAELGGEGGAIALATATLDGEEISDAWDGQGFSVSLSGLEATRHTLRFSVTDEDGYSSKELYVPFWLDDRDWEGGLMYYAFIDRVADGDISLNTSEGATYDLGSYMGGDFQGLIDLLPYLDDLGVTVIWIANPQDNAENAWDADCGTYSGYHGYWPDAAREVEEHYGDEETLKALVDAAHARNMRVLMDWVVNHVHEDHPYYQNHADDWFNDEVLCEIDGDGSNFDLIPEVCWFAGYLPDINFYNPEPLDQVLDDALWWIKTFGFDGFRVDGAKHVPHSVPYNLAGRLRQEVEHVYVGGDEDFYTVGETYTTSYDWITDFVNDHELDAQFDFPLFFDIRSAFLDYSISLPDLMSSRSTSDYLYGDAVMSQFLGNHDVSRWTSYAESGGWADSDDSMCVETGVSTDWTYYAKLRLAWTFLLTHPGLPLIYYGDEWGIPGFKDPSNRQPLWWYDSAVNSGASTDLLAVSDGLYHPDQHAGTLWHVAELGTARREHPAFFEGTQSSWWEEEHLYAYARSTGSDHLLVVLNRSDTDRQISNGLAWAGLPAGGSWYDVVSGETLQAAGDELTVSVGAYSSRVLVVE